MEEIEHSLSRLAIAKAIKTPLDGELNAESWNKSIIFNQPFIRDLHKQRQQLLSQQHQSHCDETRTSDNPVSKKQQHSRCQHARNLSSSTSSQVSGKESARSLKWKQHTCLPSDDEEDEDEDEDDNDTNDSEQEEGDADKPDHDLSFYKLKRPAPLPKISTSPTLSQKSKCGPPSLTGSSSDCLTNSPSTYTAPLTDAEEEELNNNWFGVEDDVPTDNTFHPLQNQQPQQPKMKRPVSMDTNDATLYMHHSSKLSYQQYLQKLHYQQQQMQFQQFLHHQSQQQHQHQPQQYYPTCIPYAVAPPSPMMMMMMMPVPYSAPSSMSKNPHPAHAHYCQQLPYPASPSRQHSQYANATQNTVKSGMSHNNTSSKKNNISKRHSSGRYSSTDMRRREEMNLNNIKRNNTNILSPHMTMMSPHLLQQQQHPLAAVQVPPGSTAMPSSHLRKGGRYASYIY
ncbi:hypothetical protein BDF20DRAFT_909426 [Mycotypha africana]|uniref:uncharacterized protein n=1 Tax=Mycotypha africana TaxID=64632 RepID=UPI00230060D1|nr:uncharacterized protein BDF20DRAFT_909426 [Mycotypha africana]KAI8991680.1 hypothetical protein BDF20DRAFT_909426 [Mycotypha africana]